MLIDIHTHRPALCPQGVINQSITADFSADALSVRQCWSVGIHPWDSGGEDMQGRLLALERAARLEQVVAIGETGIDLYKMPSPLAVQMELLRYHALTAETVVKPLVLHAVKAHVQIIGMHKELRARQPWIIHGFRSKPTIAQLYLNEGICLSFGEQFNAESLRLTPPHMCYAETDESPLSIAQIVAAHAAALAIDTETYTSRLAGNMNRIGITHLNHI